jgi:hypothetical protein
MTSKPRDPRLPYAPQPEEKMIFLGLGVWQELRILARLARGCDAALIPGVGGRPRSETSAWPK